MAQASQPGVTGFLPFGSAQGATPAGVAPQGFDFGQFAQQLAGQAAQALPGLIMSVLSAQPQLRAQSAAPEGVSPQGFDFGRFAHQLAGQAAQALPGLIMGLLAAHPTIGPQLAAQSAGPQGVSPQSLLNIQTPFGGASLFGATPQAGVSPQGFDFGQFAQQLAGQAAQALPGLIMGLLAANPTIAPQQAAAGSAMVH
ncbi:MAG TPA: hypothetical protein VMI72_14740 [Roseiarcus sp.]|nr:hypothetical protein [Roseiarcus sp.]